MNRTSRLQQRINELLNSAYSYKKQGSALGGRHHYSFDTENGKKINVKIVHHDDLIHDKTTGHVSFESGGSMMKTNAEGHASHKVFGTVKKIIKDHMEKHPEVSKIAFSASKAEGSRGKLYKTMARSMSSKHKEFEDKHDHTFEIDKEHIK